MRRITQALLACAGLAMVTAAARAENSLVTFAKQILSQIAHSPMPNCLDPLIQIAENADGIALAGLETWCGVREREILLEMISATGAQERKLRRELKAIQELKSKLNRIKQQRAAEERKKKEEGWDPFYARYAALGPVLLPGVNSFVLLVDPTDDEPGDAPPGPVVALTAPPWCANTVWLLPVFASAATASFTPSAAPGTFNISLLSFAQTVGSFDLLPGMPTGINTASLNEFGSAPKGTMNPAGVVNLAWEGKYVNGVNNGRAPMLFFASAHGLLKAPGQATMAADDPMIFPMPPGIVPHGAPWLRGAAVYAFDAGSMTLRVNENTVVVPIGPAVAPDIAMMRDCEGRHTYRPYEDIAVTARLVIPPLPYTGFAAGVHHFADVPYSIVSGVNTLLSGVVTGITLDPVGLIFEGALSVDPIAPAVLSRSCNQIRNAPGPRRLAFASAATVADLVDLSASFTTSATMPFPEVFAIEATGSVACPSDLNGDTLVDDADFVIFAGDYNELLVPPASPWSDLNGDGFVDDNDFVVFAVDYDELLCM